MVWDARQNTYTIYFERVSGGLKLYRMMDVCTPAGECYQEPVPYETGALANLTFNSVEFFEGPRTLRGSNAGLQSLNRLASDEKFVGRHANAE